MAVNKLVYNGKILIDLTKDTINPNNMLENIRAHQKDGTVIYGKIKADQVIPIGATEHSILLSINDVNNNNITDSNNNIIYGKNIYKLI